MNDPVREWIPAYHDGELSAALREQVEAHLPTCPDCRADLAELRALSGLLEESPLALSEPAEAFARRVVGRLPGRQERFAERALRFGLRALPVGLFAAWAFWQAVAAISQGLLLVSGLVPGAGQLVSALIPPAGLSSGEFDLLGFNLLGGLLGVSPVDAAWLDSFGSFVLVSLLLAVVFVGLFLAWLGGWWAYHRSTTMQS